METTLEHWDARAALDWQVELGADEPIGDAPINRYELAERSRAPAAPKQPQAKSAATPVPIPPREPDAETHLRAARAAAQGAADLSALEAALRAFEGSPLREGARSCVFADGNPSADLLILGEAPGRDEDREGRPFVGRAGQLLDKMFAAIGLSRGAQAPEEALYITNVLPWRPPQNRTPSAEEIALFLPFVERHIALVAPKVIVTMGNTPCQALLGKSGITRLHGQWHEALGRPVLPMFHPAYLLRQPQEKRKAWADLLALKAKLTEAQ